MTIQLTAVGMREVYPKAPQAVIDAFVAKQSVLDKAGITHTRSRLAPFLANIEHECGGFTIRNLTENTNYTAERMAAVWSSRFPGGAAQVRAKYGTAAGWQLLALDDIYGSRMGNKPGTRDGSQFIGRGGPQWTGRDGYAALSAVLGMDAVALPELAARYDLQPEVCAAFWSWKKMNAKADLGDWRGIVKAWNGGTNGLADREAQLKGNDAALVRMEKMSLALEAAKKLPGAPPTPEPPKAVIDDATKKERATQKTAVASAVTGGGSEAAKISTTTAPAVPSFMTPVVTYSLLGIGVVAFVVVAVLIARKAATIKANWF